MSETQNGKLSVTDSSAGFVTDVDEADAVGAREDLGRHALHRRVDVETQLIFLSPVDARYTLHHTCNRRRQVNICLRINKTDQLKS